MALSGGAFRDMTRVAYLDETMWTDLFMRNRDNLIGELKGVIGELSEYLEALEQGDQDRMTELLAEGRRRKEMTERMTPTPKEQKKPVDAIMSALS